MRNVFVVINEIIGMYKLFLNKEVVFISFLKVKESNKVIIIV